MFFHMGFHLGFYVFPSISLGYIMHIRPFVAILLEILALSLDSYTTLCVMGGNVGNLIC